MRCLKKFIFSVQGTRKPQRAESQAKLNSISHPTVPSKSKRIFTVEELLKNLCIELAGLALGGGAAFLKLAGDVFDS